jgi:hypothetical protein
VSSRLLSSGLALVACVACDARLADLTVAPWQPTALAAGEGDLLADAEQIDVTLVVDDVPQEFTLAGGLRAPDRPAAPDGSRVRVELRTRGSDLADALGRSGETFVGPEDDVARVVLVLAPADLAHALSEDEPDAREGAALCAADDGRVWIIGGERAGGLLPGSFLLSPEDRDVGVGPGLPTPRSGAACVDDGDGGLWLLGGCDESGAPVDALTHASRGDRSGTFDVEETSISGACEASLARTRDGVLLGLLGDRLFRRDAAGGVATIRLGSPRFGGKLAVAGDGERVLLTGGYLDAGRANATAGASLISLAGDAIEEVLELAVTPDAVGRGADGRALGVVGDDLYAFEDDGSAEVLAEDVLPASFVASDVVPLSQARWAILDDEGDQVWVGDATAGSAIALAPARPGGRLFVDPGGAIRVVGGGAAGVAVIVPGARE